MPGDLAVYLVTDPDYPGRRTVAEVCLEAVQSGVRVVQLRDKRASTRSLVEQARALKTRLVPHRAVLLINDRVDVALAAGADGVHLGQDDLDPADARRLLGPEAVIGVSVQTPQEARAAGRCGATYLAASPVYTTPTKPELNASLGLDGLRRLRAASTLPLVAIGGIKGENAAEVMAAGADGVAVVSAIMAAEDVSAACRELSRAVAEGRSRRSSPGSPA